MGNLGLNSTVGKSTKVKSSRHVLSRFVTFFCGIKIAMADFVTFCHVLSRSDFLKNPLSQRFVLAFTVPRVWRSGCYVGMFVPYQESKWCYAGPKRLSNPLSLSSVEDSSSKSSASSSGITKSRVPSTCS